MCLIQTPNMFLFGIMPRLLPTLVQCQEKKLSSSTHAINLFYRVFHQFGQAKFPDGGSALGLRLFSILPQLHQETMLASKGVTIDSKISNSCR